MERGYVKLWRKSIESEVFADKNLWQLWSWCLMRTNYSKKFVPIKSGRGTITVKVTEGSFIFGRNKAAEQLNESPSSIWKRMKKLESIGCISIESNNQYSIVSICNWSDYQNTELEKEQPSDNQVTAKGTPSDTNKNKDNKENEKNKPLFHEDVVGLVELFIGLSKNNKFKFKEPDEKGFLKWCDSVEKINRIDKYSFEDIKRVIIYGTSDEFWSSNFLSLGVVRNKKTGSEYTKFDNIYNSMVSKKQKNNRVDDNGWIG